MMDHAVITEWAIVSLKLFPDAEPTQHIVGYSKHHPILSPKNELRAQPYCSTALKTVDLGKKVGTNTNDFRIFLEGDALPKTGEMPWELRFLLQDLYHRWKLPKEAVFERII